MGHRSGEILAYTSWSFGSGTLCAIWWKACCIGSLRLHGQSVESWNTGMLTHPSRSYESRVFITGECVPFDGKRLAEKNWIFISIQFDGIHVVSGSLDTSIRVWDAETGSCKHTLMGHQSLTSGMELRQNILVSGNADSTVKVWDITNGQCLQTLSGKLRSNCNLNNGIREFSLDSSAPFFRHFFLNFLINFFRTTQTSISCDMFTIQYTLRNHKFRWWYR